MSTDALSAWEHQHGEMCPTTIAFKMLYGKLYVDTDEGYLWTAFPGTKRPIDYTTGLFKELITIARGYDQRYRYLWDKLPPEFKSHNHYEWAVHRRFSNHAEDLSTLFQDNALNMWNENIGVSRDSLTNLVIFSPEFDDQGGYIVHTLPEVDISRMALLHDGIEPIIGGKE